MKGIQSGLNYYVLWRLFLGGSQDQPEENRTATSTLWVLKNSKKHVEQLQRRVAATQSQHYSTEVGCLLDNRPLPASSKLRRFIPFLDAHGLLRVGGRLQNAFLGEQEKHPIIIPCESHIDELLIRDAHLKTLHGGPHLVQSHLLRTYWIIRARNRIRRLTRQCVRCTRFQGQKQTQQMTPLSAARVTPARTFSRTGLDYAGPFQLRTTKGCGHKSYKGYVCVFICLVTRAIHLEVVSDFLPKLPCLRLGVL